MSGRTQIMGILNVTPDSFSDGGRHDALEAAVARAKAMIAEGADILDIGGESTRPGAALVPVEEELRRVVPVIKAIREATDDEDPGPVISVDTRKPEVAEAAILAGADIWNDVSALTFSDKSLPLAADLGCPVILMHAQGTPETMQDNPTYRDPVTDIRDWLRARVDACVEAGIERSAITLDPGIGFGKTLEDNLALLRNLDAFTALGCPLLIGTSRKSFIQKIDGSPVDRRLPGSLASALYAVQKGASILRVHDVAETQQALRVWSAIAAQ